MKFLFRLYFFICPFICPFICLSQVNNSGLMDNSSGTTLKNITIGGYIDTYYGYSTAKTAENTVPYFVSMAQNNEMNINLAFVDVRYFNKNIRARFVPGFGTYMNANYANETGNLKNIVEASVGVKLSKSKEIWLDAGVLGSPYTNESAISKDHLMYTRSFAPEYVPYYLSGVKLSVPLSKKVIGYFYLLNGWQQIKDNNEAKSIGTQLEYRPNDNHLINWNTYIGSEKSISTPNFSTRYFTDIYWIYTQKKFSFTSCAYIGNQKKEEVTGKQSNNLWWQANFIGKYAFTEKLSISGRLEYFNDENAVQIQSLNQINGFKTYSSSICGTLKINENALIRIEARHFQATDKVYMNKNNTPSEDMFWIVSNITIWF